MCKLAPRIPLLKAINGREVMRIVHVREDSSTASPTRELSTSDVTVPGWPLLMDQDWERNLSQKLACHHPTGTADNLSFPPRLAMGGLWALITVLPPPGVSAACAASHF